MALHQLYNKSRQCNLGVMQEFTRGSFEISGQAEGGEGGEREEQQQQKGGQRSGQGGDKAGEQEA